MTQIMAKLSVINYLMSKLLLDNKTQGFLVNRIIVFVVEHF